MHIQLHSVMCQQSREAVNSSLKPEAACGRGRKGWLLLPPPSTKLQSLLTRSLWLLPIQIWLKVAPPLYSKTILAWKQPWQTKVKVKFKQNKKAQNFSYSDKHITKVTHNCWIASACYIEKNSIIHRQLECLLYLKTVQKHTNIFRSIFFFYSNLICW